MKKCIIYLISLIALLSIVSCDLNGTSKPPQHVRLPDMTPYDGFLMSKCNAASSRSTKSSINDFALWGHLRNGVGQNEKLIFTADRKTPLKVKEIAKAGDKYIVITIESVKTFYFPNYGHPVDGPFPDNARWIYAIDITNNRAMDLTHLLGYDYHNFYPVHYSVRGNKIFAPMHEGDEPFYYGWLDLDTGDSGAITAPLDADPVHVAYPTERGILIAGSDKHWQNNYTFRLYPNDGSIPVLLDNDMMNTLFNNHIAADPGSEYLFLDNYSQIYRYRISNEGVTEEHYELPCSDGYSLEKINSRYPLNPDRSILVPLAYYDKNKNCILLYKAKESELELQIIDNLPENIRASISKQMSGDNLVYSTDIGLYCLNLKTGKYTVISDKAVKYWNIYEAGVQYTSDECSTYNDYHFYDFFTGITYDRYEYGMEEAVALWFEI